MVSDQVREQVSGAFASYRNRLAKAKAKSLQEVKRATIQLNRRFVQLADQHGEAAIIEAMEADSEAEQAQANGATGVRGAGA